MAIIIIIMQHKAQTPPHRESPHHDGRIPLGQLINSHGHSSYLQIFRANFSFIETSHGQIPDLLQQTPAVRAQMLGPFGAVLTDLKAEYGPQVRGDCVILFPLPSNAFICPPSRHRPGRLVNPPPYDSLLV